MLTSKEIIERTGISRATLNNYIASGLVARPQVLPPGPEHGAAPRIGYFPDGSSSGGNITLSEARRSSRVDVDWLTGAVTVSAQP